MASKKTTSLVNAANARKSPRTIPATNTAAVNQADTENTASASDDNLVVGIGASFAHAST